MGIPAVAGWFQSGKIDNPWSLLYSVGALVWITLFSQYWQRQERRLAYRWGTEDFEDEERVSQPRSAFLLQVDKEEDGFYTREGWFVSPAVLDATTREGKQLGREECPLAGKDVLAFIAEHKWKRIRRFELESRWWRQLATHLLIGFATIGFALVTASILSTSTLLQVYFHINGVWSFLDGFFRYLVHHTEVLLAQSPAYLQEHATPFTKEYLSLQLGRYIGSGTASVWVAISNGILSTIARLLTDFEIHRTETEYEVHLSLTRSLSLSLSLAFSFPRSPSFSHCLPLSPSLSTSLPRSHSHSLPLIPILTFSPRVPCLHARRTPTSSRSASSSSSIPSPPSSMSPSSRPRA